MSLSKLSSLDHQKVSSRLQKASSTEFFSEHLVRLVNAHSDAIGAPLTTRVHSLATPDNNSFTNGYECSHQDKPRVVWTKYHLVCYSSEKGIKAALKRLRKPIGGVQRKLHVDWVQDDNDEKPVHAPQLIVDHFSFKELHFMCRNWGQVLGLFDEISSFYGQLDLYKHSSTVDRKTLLTLNGGDSRSQQCNNGEDSI